ncbi:site-specific integrase [uncultured Sphaerochaeta sp.]|uniref:site-specific integrase n=1 Tax=uncultured Sphaerochaeta sp. TaxID=886478 RepID=UPI00261D4106|nr:site-specific integrase [uncultured Sphaerochaeta sp.]
MSQVKLIAQGTNGMDLEAMSGKVREILEAGTATNTRKAHQGDIEYFMAWVKLTVGHDMDLPTPPTLLIQFIVEHLFEMNVDKENELVRLGVKARRGRHSLNTVSRRLASLSALHELNRMPNPCRDKEVTSLLSKARRASAKKGEMATKKRAITRDILEVMLSTCGSSLIDTRDKAILLFAFSTGGRRRSEVASARMEHLAQVDGGYIYHLPFSKTDQDAHGMDLPLLGRASIALDTWLKISGITEGFVFRSIRKGGAIGEGLSDKAVALIVKSRVQQAGLDPDLFSGHSLRSGFITEAGRQGKPLGDVMALSGHKTVRVCLGYYQAGSVVHNSAALLAE